MALTDWHRSAKPFFGWTVVLGCFVGMLGNTGQVVYGSLGVMIKPLTAEFGWGRGEISLALTFLTLAIAVTIPIAGLLVDRFGSRNIAALSIIFSSLILLTFPFFISTLLLFHLMIIFLSIAGAPTNTVAYVRVISNWFDRRRGLFIGINASGLGLGFAVMPLLADWGVRTGGWKIGYVFLGLFLLCVVFPAVFLTVIDKPQNVGMQPNGNQREPNKFPHKGEIAQGLTLGEALRTRTFWLLIVIIPTVAFALNGILSQLVPMLTDRGVHPTKAAAVASTMGFSMAVARIIVGYMLDRFFAPRVGSLVFAAAMGGIALLLYGEHLWISFLAAAIMGFGIGAEADLMAYLVSRYFGLTHFGVIFGSIFTSYLIGTGLGPFILGKSFDTSGTYTEILYVCMGLCLLATVLLSLFKPYEEHFSAVNRPGIPGDSRV